MAASAVVRHGQSTQAVIRDLRGAGGCGPLLAVHGLVFPPGARAEVTECDKVVPIELDVLGAHGVHSPSSDVPDVHGDALFRGPSAAIR